MVITEDMKQCGRIQEETKSLEKVRPFFAHCKEHKFSLQPTIPASPQLAQNPVQPIESGKCAKTNSVGRSSAAPGMKGGMRSRWERAWLAGRVQALYSSATKWRLDHLRASRIYRKWDVMVKSQNRLPTPTHFKKHRQKGEERMKQNIPALLSVLN